MNPPPQTPLVQVSPLVFEFPSLQEAPSCAKPSAGQAALDPVQPSATSHCPTDARHTVPAETKVQLAVQQEPATPFWVPKSQDSLPSTTPLPQEEVVPACMTVKVWPAMVKVPVREVVPVLAATE